nr:PIN domain-containing protein [Waterburya agarophytonicola]
MLFVNTNILLDFYRIRKSDISMKYLQALTACKERLIIGSQVEMEYKKNRQKVIIESLNRFSNPDWNKLSTPALVTGLQASQRARNKNMATKLLRTHYP